MSGIRANKNVLKKILLNGMISSILFIGGIMLGVYTYLLSFLPGVDARKLLYVVAIVATLWGGCRLNATCIYAMSHYKRQKCRNCQQYQRWHKSA